MLVFVVFISLVFTDMIIIQRKKKYFVYKNLTAVKRQ